MKDIVECGDCGDQIPYAAAHRFETATEPNKETYLCSICCPNCFGGKDNGKDHGS